MQRRRTRAMGAVMLVAAGLVMGFAVMAAADGGGGGGGDEGTRRDPTAPPRDPQYDDGVRAVKRGDYSAAIRLFEAVTARDAQNADAFNWLAYSTRKNGDAARSIPIYERALAIDPKHRGAHEYIGEAYLLTNNLSKAEEHLAALGRICLIPCEEYDDLKKAVADYRARAAR